ncbi:MAG: nuclease-related domain-containing protein [Caldilineaceae bacterium]
MAITQHLADQLVKTTSRTHLHLLGLDLLKNDAEARLCLAVLTAYGMASAEATDSAFLYVAPTLAHAQHRPPDLVLCHPATGLVIFETKGHRIDEIEGIEAGYLKVRYHNRIEPTNVIRQSEEQLYEIQNAIGRLLQDRRNAPLINALIAFPSIPFAQWQSRGYHNFHPSDVLIFEEQLNDPCLLRAHLSSLVNQGLALTSKTTPIATEHWRPIAQVFGNSDVINPIREIRGQVAEEQLGAYIDEVQSQEKYLSDEQKELVQLRVDGFPRLIRGDEYLFTVGKLTLSTVFSAKGYDAPVVFVIGTDLFPIRKKVERPSMLRPRAPSCTSSSVASGAIARSSMKQIY